MHRPQGLGWKPQPQPPAVWTMAACGLPLGPGTKGPALATAAEAARQIAQARLKAETRMVSALVEAGMFPQRTPVTATNSHSPASAGGSRVGQLDREPVVAGLDPCRQFGAEFAVIEALVHVDEDRA